MKIKATALMASVLLFAGLAASVDANAQGCLLRGPVAGDTVRLELASYSVFWFQPMTLTVRRYDEFAQPRENPGGTFCGVATVLLSGSLLDVRADGGNRVVVSTDTYLMPGTRLRLSEFVFNGSNVDSCSTVGTIDPCSWNGDLYRTATVMNR